MSYSTATPLVHPDSIVSLLIDFFCLIVVLQSVRAVRSDDFWRFKPAPPPAKDERQWISSEAEPMSVFIFTTVLKELISMCSKRVCGMPTCLQVSGKNCKSCHTPDELLRLVVNAAPVVDRFGTCPVLAKQSKTVRRSKLAIICWNARARRRET